MGHGISELRIYHGPSYRVYFMQRGSMLGVLAGGNKRTQPADIKLARRIAIDWERE